MPARRCRTCAGSSPPPAAPSQDREKQPLPAQFRGANIGRTEKASSRRYGTFYYEVFPQSCVSMIGAMALSSSELDRMISLFAAEQDMSTAQWLVNLKQGALQSNVQKN